MRKVALFGGTFDPPHAGHLKIAEGARSACGLERVVFLPCRQSPHKLEVEPGASAGDRLAMTRLATGGLPWAEVSDFEVLQDGPSYSWRTAEHFAGGGLPSGDRRPVDLHWILGADQWKVIDRWARPERLAELLTFIVFTRGESRVASRAGFRSIFLSSPHPASSTEIRECLRTGRPVPDDWLCPAVERFIVERGLYRGIP